MICKKTVYTRFNGPDLNMDVKLLGEKTKSNKRGQIIGGHMCHKIEKNAKTL